MLDFLDTLHDFSITWKLENTIYICCMIDKIQSFPEEISLVLKQLSLKFNKAVLLNSFIIVAPFLFILRYTLFYQIFMLTYPGINDVSNTFFLWGQQGCRGFFCIPMNLFVLYFVGHWQMKIAFIPQYPSCCLVTQNFC